MATIDEIVAAQTSRADTMASTAEDKINAALAAAASYFSVNRPAFTMPASITVQPFESNADFSADFLAQYGAVVDSLDPELLDKLNAFLTEFFPSFNVCTEVVEQWICDQIQNGGMGLPLSVESAMFQRGRDRLLMEGARAEEDIIARFASRGFTVPSGVMTKMLDSVQREVQRKIADYNRDVIVEQAKIQVETTKFAVDKALEMKRAVIGAMLDYLGRYMGIYGLAFQKASGTVDAKRNMYNTMSDYYRSLLASGQLDIEKIKFAQSDALEWQKTDGDFFERWATRKTNASMAAADSFSRMAASAQQSVNAIASLAG